MRGEYTIGVVESPGLDNVVLTGISDPIPEQIALIVLMIAGVTLALARHRRQDRHSRA